MTQDLLATIRLIVREELKTLFDRIKDLERGLEHTFKKLEGLIDQGKAEIQKRRENDRKRQQKRRMSRDKATPVVMSRDNGHFSSENGHVTLALHRPNGSPPTPPSPKNSNTTYVRMDSEKAKELAKEYGMLVYRENKPFIDWCKENNKAPTVVRFRHWLENRKNDTFQASPNIPRPIQPK